MFSTPLPRLRTACDRERVVGCELLAQFMRESRYRHLAIAVMKAGIVIFCFAYVNGSWLLVWFAAGIGTIAYRLSVEKHYVRLNAFCSVQEQEEFIRALKPVYALHGAIWGVSTLFYFDGLPTSNQYACGLIMACIAALPLRSAALVPELLRLFMNILFSVTAACVVVATMTSLINANGTAPVTGPAWISHYLFAIVPVFQWWLLRSVGLRVYANQRRQYEVQYDLESKEEQARALAESKTRFIAAAAHDLRQPVMALSIYADQLLERPAEHVMLAPRIAKASNAVVHLFDSLFDLANLDSGKVHLRIEPVSVRELLAELVHQFESTANSKAICLKVHHVDAVISTDAVRFRRMLANVISNAIKYSAPQTTVRIMATHVEDALRIEVADQGFGIPQAEQARVFEEFYRVSHPNHTAEDGVGLGLSIVSRLAKLLQCEIEFQSVEGKGTRISFSMQYREDRHQGPQTSFGVG